ncbi:MAG: HAMP domain-containing protein, partial [Deltaproteobacteria bacterium]|nr:HAMP domain-containing protein [Deltaproteobacteria bacterium]
GPPPWVAESEGTITFVSPIVFKQTTVGYAVVLFSDDFIKERVQKAVTSVVLVAGIAIIIVSLISVPMASGLLRPIFRLFKGTKEIALGNFDYRIPDKSNDEMGDLVRSFNKMASELKEKELHKGIFSRYVSPQVADEILKEPERIRLGGERREVTVFFADIRDFTALSRKMLPEETVEILNRYFTLITEIIFRFNGTVDKFIGDAVMGVFGSPIRNETHLEHGVKAAAAIKKALEVVNRSRRSKGLVPLQMGLGVDSGEVIVGNMGSKSRMEFTAVGDSVNIASRLADLARGGEIIISESVYGSIKDNVIAEPMHAMVIKGFEHPLTLYSLVDLRGRWKEEVEEIVSSAVTQLENEGFVP